MTAEDRAPDLGRLSAAFGKQIGIAMSARLAEPGTKLKVKIQLKEWDAVVIEDSPFDPTNARIRGRVGGPSEIAARRGRPSSLSRTGSPAGLQVAGLRAARWDRAGDGAGKAGGGGMADLEAVGHRVSHLARPVAATKTRSPSSGVCEGTSAAMPSQPPPPSVAPALWSARSGDHGDGGGLPSFCVAGGVLQHRRGPRLLELIPSSKEAAQKWRSRPLSPARAHSLPPARPP